MASANLKTTRRRSAPGSAPHRRRAGESHPPNGTSSDCCDELLRTPLWRSSQNSPTTAFLEKDEPLRERSPQHSVSTKGLGPCASQPGGPFSAKTALVGNHPYPEAHSCKQGCAAMCTLHRGPNVSRVRR